MKKYKVDTLLWEVDEDFGRNSERIEFHVEAIDHDDAWREADCYMVMEHNQELHNADTTIVEVQ